MICLAVLFIPAVLSAQDAKGGDKADTPAKGATMVFDNDVIDYGTIEHNADGNREFTFTNTGTEPLIITNAKGSCGCTVPTWPKEPIAPGETGIMKVKYATNRVGAFNKTITVSSNAVESPTKILRIKGNVLQGEQKNANKQNLPTKSDPSKPVNVNVQEGGHDHEGHNHDGHKHDR